MPKKRCNAEDIIHKLREAEVLVAQGSSIIKACIWSGISRNSVCYEPQPRADADRLDHRAGWPARALRLSASVSGVIMVIKVGAFKHAPVR